MGWNYTTGRWWKAPIRRVLPASWSTPLKKVILCFRCAQRVASKCKGKCPGESVYEPVCLEGVTYPTACAAGCSTLNNQVCFHFQYICVQWRNSWAVLFLLNRLTRLLGGWDKCPVNQGKFPLKTLVWGKFICPVYCGYDGYGWVLTSGEQG